MHTFILIEKAEGTKGFGRPTHRPKDNFKMQM
jgi:hypothetical protein